MDETDAQVKTHGPPATPGAGTLRHALIVPLGFTLLFVAFFSPALFSGRLLAPGDGFNFHAPFFYGGQPLWQPLLWAGYPLAADPQVMAWYPVALACSLLPHSFNAFVIAAYVIASSFTYGYVYTLTRSRPAGLLGGLAYGLSGFMVAQQGHLSLVHTAAWVPLIFWALERVRLGLSARWLAVGSLAVACCGLAGHLQIFLYALGLAAAYTLFLGWGAAAHHRWRRLGLMAGMLALGLCLAAVQLVPAAELAGYGQRAEMSFDEFISFSLPPEHLLRMFFPYAFGGSPGSLYGLPYFAEWGPPVGGWGPTELIVYVGLLPLGLAAVGVTTRRRRPVAWFWAAVGVAALLLAAGDAVAPLARLVFHLPGYNKFRVPARHLFELALA
ncbi:MAG: YfhO family protein, partial [Pyrinomonadaceae bacterium]